MTGTSSIQAELERLVQRGLPGAFVHVSEADGRADFHSAGVSDLRSGRPMGPGDHYRIGSTTKSFTAVVVLQLVGDGELALHDLVADRLPGYPVPHPDHLTIEHLLRMRSGLFDFEDDPSLLGDLEAHFRGYSADHVVRLALAHPPAFEPGARFQYCNTNYCLLELIVEAVSNRSLGEHFVARIFGPLGLDHTTYPAVDDLSLPEPFIRGYERRDGGWHECSEVFFGRGDGAIVSTVTDVERFFRALFGGHLLPPELLGQMMTLVEDDPPAEFAYGLGLIADTLGGRTVWGHAGGGYGYAHAPYLDLATGRFVVCMKNGSHGYHVASEDEVPMFGPELRQRLYELELT